MLSGKVTTDVDINGKNVFFEFKAGKWWGLCPFHKESIPSFSLRLDGNYYCFGCHKKGFIDGGWF